MPTIGIRHEYRKRTNCAFLAGSHYGTEFFGLNIYFEIGAYMTVPAAQLVDEREIMTREGKTVILPQPGAFALYEIPERQYRQILNGNGRKRSHPGYETLLDTAAKYGFRRSRRNEKVKTT